MQLPHHSRIASFGVMTLCLMALLALTAMPSMAAPGKPDRNRCEQNIPAAPFRTPDIHFTRHTKLDLDDVPEFIVDRDAKRVLVLYDSTGTWGWMGKLYAEHLSNLLSHFRTHVKMQPVEDYKDNAIERFDFTFYIGALYDTPLSADFLNDVLTTNKPICWIGSNLWKIAWTPDFAGYNPDFEAKFGIRYLGLDFSGYPVVRYKGVDLPKNQLDPSENAIDVVDPTLATVPAVSVNAAGEETPYIAHGGNFWYVADNPFVYVDMGDRQLAFDDLLHDMLGSKVKESHRAYIRIEDVSPKADPDAIRTIADYLASQKVPFGICVIPEYRDPLGVYNDGVPETVTLAQAPEFVAALKYAVKRGGEIVMHGYTHQYNATPNPYSAVSAEDFEFFRVTLDPVTGRQIYSGPVPEDSKNWATQRVQAGIKALTAQRLAPVAWNTPHYIASPEDYKVFNKYFNVCLDRGLYFSTGQDGTLYYLQQIAPFMIYHDQFNMAHIPENIGYVDPDGTEVGGASLPADMIARAKSYLAVRDSVVGCYFHWYLDPAYLKELVTGVKGLGYRFSSIDDLN